jgi:response regulator RpfG family c-di-GMP phosphodiesterase
VESQNERWDGSGSPEGKRGDTIPTLGRILGLALELDGKLHKNSEEGGEMTIKDALLKLKDTADRQFDKETLNALFKAYRNARLFNQEEEFFEIPLN